MRQLLLSPFLFVCALLGCSTASAQDLSFGQAMLERAIRNTATLGSFHVRAELFGNTDKTTVEGLVGKTSLSLRGKGQDGVERWRVVQGDRFHLSSDQGRNWQTGEQADPDGTTFLAQLVTAPVNPALEVWRDGSFLASEETIDGKELLRIEKPATPAEPATVFWLAPEPRHDHALVVRRVSLTVATESGDLPVLLHYSQHGETVDIPDPGSR